jgi:flavin reductase (DIM6/NTAB) family NADH-FMN oxidoreductase RutF
MIDTIVPRPIAWVTTRDAASVPNLAPFSFFTGVTSSPPTLLLSITKRVRRREGAVEVVTKDTLANIEATSVFIVHVAPDAQMQAVLASSHDNRPTPDELTGLGFSTERGTWVDAPRIRELPIAMECRLDRLIPVGDPPATLVLGHILGWHVRDDLERHGRVDTAWGPLARLGVEGYARLGERLSAPPRD